MNRHGRRLPALAAAALAAASLLPCGCAMLIIVFEKYLRLTAREPVESPAAQPARSEELWNHHLSVGDEQHELAPCLPVLIPTSADCLGVDSGAEKTLGRRARRFLPSPAAPAL